MAYNEFLADRIRRYFQENNHSILEKKMMGGLCFMLDDKMCVGIVKDQLMARIGEEAQEEAMKKDGCKEMDFTKRPMKGYVFVTPEGWDLEEDMEYYLNKAVEFNPIAKSSKKKNK